MFTNISDKHFLAFSAAFAGLKTVFDTYIFSDWQFVIFLFSLVIVDTILGTYKAWKSKTIESRAYSRLFEKILLYSGVLVTSHILISFPISGAPNGFFGWCDDVLYCAMIVREAISIFENVGEIKPDLLPKWILSRLKRFDESGEFKDLI